MDNFVHLHNHSSYSLLDGIIQPKDLAKQAKTLSQPAIALTDHGSIAGWIKFYRACKDENIKPILGCEIYIDFTAEFSWLKKTNHLTVLCKNNAGYTNLIKLHNISTIKHGFKRIRVTYEQLSEHRAGLIILSGCPNSIFAKMLENDKDPEEMFIRFQRDFGDDFYVELMNHGLDIEKKLSPKLRYYADKLGIKRVATNDVHYLKRDDSEPQYIAMLDAMKKSIGQPDVPERFPSEFYLKKSDEMIGFEDIELYNSIEIANKCNVTISKYTDAMPVLQDDIDKHLICPLEKLPKSYKERYDYELNIIQEANLGPYFNIVCDFLDFANKNDIFYGPGRGSIGGSLYAFMHGIHKVNPVKYNLYFSRFYNHGRKGGMPDIDMDFSKDGINDMYKYLKSKYGEFNVAHIGISGKAGVKGALKMVCRTMGIDFQTSNNYSKMVPDKPENIYDILDNQEAKLLYDNDTRFKKVIDITSKTEGINFSFGTHASGIIISSYNLIDKMPLRLEETELLVSYWDMEDAEWLGFLKFDFLTIDTLDIIKKTLKMIGRHSYDYIIQKFDPEVFKFIQNDSHIGLFQITSNGISQLVRNMKPDNIMEIANVLAIYRPGPLESQVHHHYCNRKFGMEEITVPHESMEPILRETFGNLIYQESVIRICMELGDFSEVDADTIRKIIGKKKSRETELIAKMKEKFIHGALSKGIDASIVEDIWNQMEAHSGYSFNKAHALEYGYITYITAFLKKNHPAEFMAACLTMSKNEIETAKYLNECKRLNIKVTTPDIKKSKQDFIVKDGVILFSLNSIKNAGENFLSKILEWQLKGNLTIDSLILFVKPNKRVLESLIRCGALDSFIENGMSLGEHRGKLLHNLVKTNQLESMQYTGDLFGETISNLWEPLTEKEMMYDEKIFLGAFINKNPMDDNYEYIKKYYQLDLNEVPDFPISIAGIVDKIVKKYDKNKNEFAIINIIQHNNVPVNVVAYSKIWSLLYDKIKINQIIGINGRVREAGNFIIDKLLTIME